MAIDSSLAVGMTSDFGERGGKGGGASAAPFSPSTSFKNRSRVIPTIGRNLIHHHKFAPQIANENRNKKCGIVTKSYCIFAIQFFSNVKLKFMYHD